MILRRLDKKSSDGHDVLYTEYPQIVADHSNVNEKQSCETAQTWYQSPTSLQLHPLLQQ